MNPVWFVVIGLCILFGSMIAYVAFSGKKQRKAYMERCKKYPPINFPDKIEGACEDCKNMPVPPWLIDEMNCGLPYRNIREDIVRITHRDCLHSKCAFNIIRAYDNANGYVKEKK